LKKFKIMKQKNVNKWLIYTSIILLVLPIILLILVLPVFNSCIEKLNIVDIDIQKITEISNLFKQNVIFLIAIYFATLILLMLIIFYFTSPNKKFKALQEKHSELIKKFDAFTEVIIKDGIDNAKIKDECIKFKNDLSEVLLKTKTKKQ
jgi:hypothetical protein